MLTGRRCGFRTKTAVGSRKAHTCAGLSQKVGLLIEGWVRPGAEVRASETGLSIALLESIVPGTPVCLR